MVRKKKKEKEREKKEITEKYRFEEFSTDTTT